MVFPCLAHWYGWKTSFNYFIKFCVVKLCSLCFWGGVFRFSDAHWKTEEYLAARQPLML